MKNVLFLLLLGCVGCMTTPAKRPEPVSYEGKVNLAVSPKDLTVSFQPMQNTLPGGAKVGPDGRFNVKLSPGTYIVYFNDEANAKVPAYRSIPPKFKAPNEENKITVASGELVIDVK